MMNENKKGESHQMPPSHRPRSSRIRAIIFDLDNTLFDFVAAKQHACREVAKFLGRDDWEALFSCFLNSPHGFESHENIKDYFDLCGLLETASCTSKIESPVDLLNPLARFTKAEPMFGILEECNTGKKPEVSAGGRNKLPDGCSIPPNGHSTPEIPGAQNESRLSSGPSSSGNNIPPITSPPDARGGGWLDIPGGRSISGEACSPRPSNKAVRDNLLADKSLYCNEVFSRCCTLYETEKVRVLEPYPGVRETLGKLRRRGFPLAVLTDAHNGNALARLRKVGLDGYFDHVISFDMTGCKKPAPDAFLLALKLLQTRPEETLLVGDSLRRDIAPAQALGMITAYAKYGDRNIRALDPPRCTPDYVLNDIGELLGVVQGTIFE